MFTLQTATNFFDLSLPTPTAFSPPPPSPPQFFFLILANKKTHLVPAHCPALLLHHDHADLIHHGSFSWTVPHFGCQAFLVTSPSSSTDSSSGKERIPGTAAGRRARPPFTPRAPCDRPSGLMAWFSQSSGDTGIEKKAHLLRTSFPGSQAKGTDLVTNFLGHETIAPDIFLTGLVTSVAAKILAISSKCWRTMLLR